MASFFSTSCKTLLFLTILSSLHLFLVAGFEFDVGDTAGWAVPPHNDTQIYNEWASKNRFQIGDTINFKYKKDSVMVVSKVDYEQCNSLHPLFFSNTGETVFKLDRAELFYFISGVSGHCERGQKMIVKVLGHSPAPENPLVPPGGYGGPPPPPGEANGGVPKTSISSLVFVQLIMLFLGVLFF
ncbi:early nodulin-like protein 21 [Tasmannia lanceolata]|uniref:early nodulin-like protein 21 n=1 Tax=Tasmannia lanceolata TaxID=3420 RepID=UPI00406419E3